MALIPIQIKAMEPLPLGSKWDGSVVVRWLASLRALIDATLPFSDASIIAGQVFQPRQTIPLPQPTDAQALNAVRAMHPRIPVPATQPTDDQAILCNQIFARRH